MDTSPSGASQDDLGSPHASQTLRAEVERLRERVRDLEQEKDEMTENFRMTTSVLLERIKSLEQEKAGLETRPGTALVLDNLEKEPRRRGSHCPEVLTLDPVPEGEEPEDGVCGNCGKRVPQHNLASHTV